MTNPYRAMCAELIDALDSGIPAGRIRMSPLAARARALLAQPVAEGPADGEVAAALIELRSTVMGLDQMKMYVAAQRVKRAAELLQRQHPQPVAVSERLPGPEDCDEQGRCWLWERDCGYNGRKWALVNRDWSLSQSDEDLFVYTHWLPANALPIPITT